MMKTLQLSFSAIWILAEQNLTCFIRDLFYSERPLLNFIPGPSNGHGRHFSHSEKNVNNSKFFSLSRLNQYPTVFIFTPTIKNLGKFLACRFGWNSKTTRWKHAEQSEKIPPWIFFRASSLFG